MNRDGECTGHRECAAEVYFIVWSFLAAVSAVNKRSDLRANSCSIYFETADTSQDQIPGRSNKSYLKVV